MSEVIDCLIIGHNDMDFAEYERTIRQTDIRSGAYRDLNMNFVRYNNRPYNAMEVFNLFCREDNEDKGSGSHISPLNMLDTFSAAIAYLGTYLDKHAFTFDYVNSFQDEKEELAKKLMQENIVAIAVTTTLYVSFFPIVEVVEFIRTYNRSAKIVIGGPFVSTKARNLAPAELNFLFQTIGADFYVNSSQGETSLIKLIHVLKNNLPVAQVNNIYYKTDSGYQSTPISRENNRLSENMVNWDLFSQRVGNYAAVRTAISCPFSCAFCGFPEHAGPYQTAEVQKIEQELNRLDRIGKVKSVHFIDDTFNIPVRRFKEILKMMINKKFTFKWHSYFRSQFADKEMVEMMEESGCEGVFLGLESGSDKILKNMNKSVKPDEYYRGIQLLKEHHIVTYGNFIVGFPGEIHESVEETLHFIKDSGLDFYRAQSWYCEPITPIWRDRDKYHLKGESFEWSHSTMTASIAADLVEKIFLTLDKAKWVPQYNFDFDNIWHLKHRGMSIETIKNFLSAFNNGIEEKLANPTQKEISFQVVKRLKNYRLGISNIDDSWENPKKKINHSEAQLVF